LNRPKQPREILELHVGQKKILSNETQVLTKRGKFGFTFPSRCMNHLAWRAICRCPGLQTAPAGWF